MSAHLLTPKTKKKPIPFLKHKPKVVKPISLWTDGKDSKHRHTGGGE